MYFGLRKVHDVSHSYTYKQPRMGNNNYHAQKFSVEQLSANLKALHEATKNGDRRKQNLYFDRVYPDLYYYAVGFCRDEVEAQDAVLIALQRYFECEDSISKPTGWIVRVMRNHLINRGLSKSRRRELRECNFLPFQETSSMGEVEADLNLEALVELIQRVLDERDQRIVFLYYQGYSTEEISKIEGMTSKTVINRKGLIRNKLAAAMQPAA